MSIPIFVSSQMNIKLNKLNKLNKLKKNKFIDKIKRETKKNFNLNIKTEFFIDLNTQAVYFLCLWAPKTMKKL